MKKTILAAVILFTALAAQTQAPRPPAAPAAQELTQLLKDFLAGAGRNDAAMHDRFWADDLIYTSAIGTRRGKAEIMSSVRSAPPPSGPTGTYSAEEIRIQQYGDTAIVAFRLVSSAPQPATSTGAAQPAEPAITKYLNTGTFLKRQGEWRVVAWQATRIPDAAAPAR